MAVNKKKLKHLYPVICIGSRLIARTKDTEFWQKTFELSG